MRELIAQCRILSLDICPTRIFFSDDANLRSLSSFVCCACLFDGCGDALSLDPLIRCAHSFYLLLREPHNRTGYYHPFTFPSLHTFPDLTHTSHTHIHTMRTTILKTTLRQITRRTSHRTINNASTALRTQRFVWRRAVCAELARPLDILGADDAEENVAQTFLNDDEDDDGT